MTLATPSTNLMATTGKEECLKSAKTDSPALPAALEAEVASLEVDSAAAVDSHPVGASAAEADLEEALVAAEATAVVGISTVLLVVAPSLLPRPRILSPTTRPPVVSRVS